MPAEQGQSANAHGDAGFTLLETVIVLAVIGILSAIAVVSIANWNTNASHSGANNDATLAAQIIRECSAVGGSAPAAFTLSGPGQQVLTCGSTQSTISISDNTTLVYTPGSNGQPFTVTATASDGATYTAGNSPVTATP